MKSPHPMTAIRRMLSIDVQMRASLAKLARGTGMIGLAATSVACVDLGSNDDVYTADVATSDLVPTDSANEDTSAPPSGKTLYESQCASCHAADGKGTAIGPSVRYVPRGFGGYVVRHGRDAMPFAVAMAAYPETSLDAEALGLILDHLHTLDRPTTGSELYGMLCANCHGDDGRGGRVDTSLVGEGGEVSEKVREGASGAAYGSSDFMPAWSSGQLSNAEVALIKAHVNTF